MPTRKMWNFGEFTKIPFSGKLPGNSFLRSTCTLNMIMDMDICQIHFIFNPISIWWWWFNAILETISNIHTLIKDFSRIIIQLILAGCDPLLLGLIDSLLTYSQPSYTIHHAQYHPVHDSFFMIESEPKKGFMYIRYYGSLRSKEHMSYSH